MTWRKRVFDYGILACVAVILLWIVYRGFTA